MKFKALIKTEKENLIICSLSRIDYSNYELLKTCLPKEKDKGNYTEEEKMAIKDYNNFIDNLIKKNNGKDLKTDLKISKLEEF